MDIYIGTKFFGHDSAIFAVIPKTKKIFAISTERLTRYKHDIISPVQCLQKFFDYFSIDLNKINKIYFSQSFIPEAENEFVNETSYYEKIYDRKYFGARFINEYKKKRLNFNRHCFFKKIISFSVSKYGLLILKQKLKNKLKIGIKIPVKDFILKELKNYIPSDKLVLSFYDHEYCHIVSSFFASNFKNPLMVSMDGHGNYNIYSRAYLIKKNNFTEITNCKSPKRFFNFSGSKITNTSECSLGGIYSHFTEMLGFDKYSDPGKVEALAAYGNFNNKVLKKLQECIYFSSKKKSIVINTNLAERYFNYDKFQILLKEYSKKDLAAAVQKLLEEVTLEYLKYLVKVTKKKEICLSGGVFANVILNLRIYEEISKKIFIIPAMADDGSAQGACYVKLLENYKQLKTLDWLKKDPLPYLGTSYSTKNVKKILNIRKNEISYSFLGDKWPEEVASLLSQNKIGAIFHGRMEWGPRALGNRSIIADPRNPDVRNLLNKEIKRRPEFQPFCPSALIEEKERLFEDAYNNKHMTCAFRMKKKFRKSLPSAIHIDGTSRVQFVEKRDNKSFYKLLKEFKKITGFGIILNTSFNKHGRTICETPNDAIDDFLDTNMDYLLIEGFLVRKLIV